jgi:hypothetical protein
MKDIFEILPVYLWRMDMSLNEILGTSSVSCLETKERKESLWSFRIPLTLCFSLFIVTR